MARKQPPEIQAARKAIRGKIALMEESLEKQKPLKQIQCCLAIRDLDRIERELAGVYMSRTCPR